MLLIPSGMLLNRCVCDGVERPFCEVVKDNMRKLCSIGDNGVSMSYGEMDDVYEDEDYEMKAEREDTQSDSMVPLSGASKLPSCFIFLHLAMLIFYWCRNF